MSSTVLSEAAHSLNGGRPGSVIPRDLWLYGAKIDGLRVRLRMGLQEFADSLREVIELGAWRCFITDIMQEPVQHERFEDFVTAPPPAGLGATMEQIRRLLRDRPDVLDLVDQVVVGRKGRPNNPWGREGKSEQEEINADIISINSSPAPGPDPHPDGTSATYALRRLRRERPDLHARVLAGELSPHRAMVEPVEPQPPAHLLRAAVPDGVLSGLYPLTPVLRRWLQEHAEER